MDKVYLSFDISTSNIGYTVWNEDGSMHSIYHISLKNKKEVADKDRVIEKGDFFENAMLSLKESLDEYNLSVEHIFIEEAIARKNQNSSTDTLNKLTAFNGICRYILYKLWGLYPVLIPAETCRALLLGKEIYREHKRFRSGIKNKTEKSIYIKKVVWEKVDELEEDIEWILNTKGKNAGSISTKSFDMSDSYCVGYAGMKLLKIT